MNKENTSRIEINSLQYELNKKAKELDGAVKKGATIEKAMEIYFEIKAIKGRLLNHLQN